MPPMSVMPPPQNNMQSMAARNKAHHNSGAQNQKVSPIFKNWFYDRKLNFSFMKLFLSRLMIIYRTN